MEGTNKIYIAGSVLIAPAFKEKFANAESMLRMQGYVGRQCWC